MKILALFLVILAIGSLASSKKHGKSKSKSSHKKVTKSQGPIDDFVNPPNAVYQINFRVTPKMLKLSRVFLDQSLPKLLPMK